MRDVVSSIAGKKQLKHKSRLYNFPRTHTETGINDYNPILLTAEEGNIQLLVKSHLYLHYILLSI